MRKMENYEPSLEELKIETYQLDDMYTKGKIVIGMILSMSIIFMIITAGIFVKNKYFPSVEQEVVMEQDAKIIDAVYVNSYIEDGSNGTVKHPSKWNLTLLYNDEYYSISTPKNSFEYDKMIGKNIMCEIKSVYLSNGDINTYIMDIIEDYSK